MAPPGQEVSPAELSPLLDPVAYLGSQGRTVWASGNLAIGWLHNLKPTQDKRVTYPRHAMGGRVALAADVRLDARDELLRKLSYPRDAADSVNDDELVLAAYLRWNSDCARHLLGDFAFVVFDRQAQALYGFTDALGTRRLFCGELACGRLIVSTEEACLLSIQELTHRWSEVGLACWLSASPHRELSLFEGIQIVACGRQFERTARGFRTTRWWPPRGLPALRYRRLDDYAEHYREILTRAVADRMPAQGAPVLCHLSGGIDSSTITAAAVALRGSDRVITLSFLYPGIASCDETAFIMHTRRHLAIRESIDWDGVLIGRADASSVPLIRPESPLAVDSQRQKDEIREASRRGCQVILTGIGGDELTRGDWTLAVLERLRRGDRSIWGELHRAARTNGMPLYRLVLNRVAKPTLRRLVPQAMRQRIFGRRDAARRLPAWLRHQRQLAARVAEQLRPYSEYRGLSDYQHTLLGMLRRSVSWVVLDCYRLNAAAAAVDVRAPLLDLRVLEFALGTPPDLWFQNGFSKYLPRLAFSSTLPYEVCWLPRKIVFDEAAERIWDKQRRAFMCSLIGQTRLRAEPASAIYRLMPAETELDEASNALAHLVYTYNLAVWINQRHRGS